MAYVYPAGPREIPDNLTAPTSTYKRHAWLAMLGLGTFVAAYMALSSWFLWTAYRLLSGLAKGGDQVMFALIGGVCAAFLAVFMLKALFFVKHRYEIDDIEITAEQQPELFAFLNQLADEAKAPRAHRVYLSPRVNAAVFYDLSILNLILPSRKNLEIGLGLVNVLNLGEFKAVLAHEFGHFAQRSMAVGRWVYIAQQIAGHIISARDMLDSFLSKLSRFDFRIAWVGWLLSLIIWSIRSVMETLFKLVILAQRALSREMEFQADLVAVSLTGSDALIHALHRLQAADDAWERSVNFAASEAHEGRTVKDIFAIQHHVIQHLQKIFGDAAYGLPPERPEQQPHTHRVFKSQLAQAPRMWATHPSNPDRENNAKKNYVHADIHPASAWELFRDAQSLQERMSLHIVKKDAATLAPIEDSLQKLDKQYQQEYLRPEYRSVYLGRSAVRHAATTAELYDQQATHSVLLTPLESLYPESIGIQLAQRRELEEQLHALEALQRGNATTPGGLLHHRGRQLQRRDLPLAIADMRREINVLDSDIQAHDKRCRTTHLAIATSFGQGWNTYLRGLLAVQHYADHNEANLRDAQGYLGNVFAIVTADGRVTSDERHRLIKAANDVYHVLEAIYSQATLLIPDRTILKRLETESWTQMLGEFKLTAASDENLGQWLDVIDSWINSTAGALGALRVSALNQLLTAESQLAGLQRKSLMPREAPPASTVPERYSVFTPGSARARQTKLDLWSRFQTADGLIATLARLAVAGGIITSVLMLGGSAGKSTITIYNGLDRTVNVSLGNNKFDIAAFANKQVEVPEAGSNTITTSANGQVIESFQQEMNDGFEHYVYNIAAASPLVEWTAAYGGATARPDRNLGALRWTTTTADVLFAEPPTSVSTKGGGATRDVLSGAGRQSPYRVLAMLNEDAGKSLSATHARWDDLASRHLMQWIGIAAQDSSGKGILQARLQESPTSTVLLRLEQDLATPDTRATVCERHRGMLEKNTANRDIQYLVDRCLDSPEARDAAFVQHYHETPTNPWLAFAAGYSLAESAEWTDAANALDVARKNLPVLVEFTALDLARVKRMIQGETVPLVAYARESKQLHNLLQLETGDSVTGPYLAYHALAEGKLDAALQHAAGAANVQSDISVLVAASDGARSELVAKALDQPLAADANAGNAWYLLGLALRTGRDASPYRSAIIKSSPNLEQTVMLFETHLKKGGKLSENLLMGLQPMERGYLCAAAVIALGNKAPAEWRTTARRLLFAAERPYFT